MSHALDCTLAARRRLDRRWAVPMFVLPIVALLFIACELHFFGEPTFHPVAEFCHFGLATIWPIFLLETFQQRRAGNPRWRQHLAYCLCPPLRLGARDAETGERIWLPALNWIRVDAALRQRVENSLNLPMIAIALMVIPLLALDHYQAEHHWMLSQVETAIGPAVQHTPSASQSSLLAMAGHPAMLFLTRLGEALIWMAFALEFVVMISVVDRKAQYCREHWIDLLVILLPLIAFLRATRMARLARLNEVSRFTRAYRLRRLVLRTQKGFMLTSVVDRVARRNPRRALTRLRDRLEEKEREIATIRDRIALTERMIADDATRDAA